VMGYKGTTKKVKEIGSELEAGSVLEGSFRKMGNRLRITTQLIDANNDSHLWAQNYDREMDDVFAIQSDIARQVAEALKVKIHPDEGTRISRPKTGNLEAYTSYLKGLRASESGGGDPLRRAQKFFLEALSLDPGYAEAYAGLTATYMEQGVVGILDPEVAQRKTLEAAQKAVSLDDSLPESHDALGCAFQVGMKSEDAVRELTKAIELNPSYGLARIHRAYVLSFLGRFEESISDFRRAEEIDPVGSGPHAGACIVLLGIGKTEESRREAQRALEVDPVNLNANSTLAYIALLEGREAEATRGFELVAKEGGRTWVGYLGYGYAMLGRRDDALKVLRSLEEEAKSSYVAPTIPAMVYAGLREADRAFELLEEAVKVKDSQICFLGTDYVWFGLRSDPRFNRLLREAGLRK